MNLQFTFGELFSRYLTRAQREQKLLGSSLTQETFAQEVGESVRREYVWAWKKNKKITLLAHNRPLALKVIHVLITFRGIRSLEEANALLSSLNLGHLSDEDTRRYAEAIAPLAIGQVPNNSICPYRGLEPFGEEHADFFFGRQVFIRDTLLPAVLQQSLVALIGPSGSGKSSAVFAGLVPRLKQQINTTWLILTCRPAFPHYQAPFLNLAQALLPTQSEREMQYVARRLQEGELSLGELLNGIELETSQQRILLIIDQFEEIYSQNRNISQEDVETYWGLLAELIKSVEDGLIENRVTVLITLRADFFNSVLLLPESDKVLQHRDIKIGAMSREEIREAIVEPARVLNAVVEPILTEKLLDDVEGAPGNLPLLQFALQQLWEKHKSLKRTTYESLSADSGGGVKGVFAEHVDRIYESYRDTGEQSQIQQLFLQLVQRISLTDATQFTKKVATRDELSHIDWSLVTQLADDKLVVTGFNETAEIETVELPHETLIQNWQRLKDWLEDNTAFLLWREQLRVALSQWRENNQESGELLRAKRLERAESWLVTRGFSLRDDEREYIETSSIYHHKAETQKKRQKRRSNLLTGGIVIFLVVATLFYINLRQAQISEQRTNGIRLMTQAHSQLPQESELGRLLAIEATIAILKHDPEPSLLADIDNLLRESLLYQGQSIALLTEHTQAITDVILSPDGGVFLSHGRREIKIWDSDSLALVNEIEKSSDIQHIAWNPDSEHFAIALLGEDETAEIWTLRGDEPRFRLNAQTQTNYLAWNSSGDELATAGANGGVIVWRLMENSVAKLFSLEHASRVTFITWDNTNSQIASISGDEVHVWNVGLNVPTPVSSFENDGRLIESIIWDEQGKRLITLENKINGSETEHMVYLWDVGTGERQTSLSHSSEITAVLWRADGTEILTGDKEGVIRLWDVDQGRVRFFFQEHTESINDLSWNHDETLFVSSSRDNRMIVWDSLTGREVVQLTSHTDEVNTALWSSDNQHIVSVSDDATIRVWNPFLGSEGASLIGHTASINDVAWNTDGSRVLTGSDDGTAIIWQARDGTNLSTLRHNGPVRQAVYSPDGNYIVTLSNDTLLRLWDAQNGTLLQTFGEEHEIGINDVVWHYSDRGLFLASGGANGVTNIWSVSPTNQVELHHTLQATGEFINEVAWDSFGTRIATVSFATIDQTQIHIWDTVSGELVSSWIGHDTNVTSVIWGLDDETIITGAADSTIKFWEAASNELLNQTLHVGFINQLTRHLERNNIAVASDSSEVMVWNPEGEVEPAILTGHNNRINQLAWHPFQMLLLTASDDLTAQVWNVDAGVPISVLRGHSGFISKAVWNPDGTQIVTASHDGTARIYFLRIDDLLHIACQRVVRNMTNSEWNTFFSDEPYQETCPDRPKLGE